MLKKLGDGAENSRNVVTDIVVQQLIFSSFASYIRSINRNCFRLLANFGAQIAR